MRASHIQIDPEPLMGLLSDRGYDNRQPVENAFLLSRMLGEVDEITLGSDDK